MEYKINLKPVIIEADDINDAENIFNKLKWNPTIDNIEENG